MPAKQTLIDILVVLVLPLLLVGGYYAFKTDDSALLSFVSSGEETAAGGDELGAKTKMALVMLGSIQLDDSLFTDPSYLALREYRVTIASSTLGRKYPFSPPPVIIERVRRAGP